MQLLQTVAVLVVACIAASCFGNGGSVLLSRSIRDSDKHHNKDKDRDYKCCNISQNQQNTTARNSSMQTDCLLEAAKTYPMKDKEFTHHSYSNFSTCYAYCLFNKMGLINSSGNISLSLAVVTASQILNTTDQNILGNINTTCGALKEVNSTFQSHTFACTTLPFRFIECVYDMVDLYCPTANQIQSDYCKNHREYLKKSYQ